MAKRFDILPLHSATDSEVLYAIGQAFGSARREDWYRWKHHEGPWGRSKGMIAVDDEGIVGVVLLLPWMLRWGGETIIALRSVEASTLPRGRGLGINARLYTELMDQQRHEDSSNIFFGTPNEMARNGVRRLGWAWLPPIRYAYHLAPAWSTTAGGVDFVDVLDAISVDHGDSAIHTAWTSEALQWRLDPRSGHQYVCARLRHEISPSGIIYRVIEHNRVRILGLLALRGEPRERKALLSAVARHERAPLTLDTIEPGGKALNGGLTWKHGDSLVAVWESSGTTDWPLYDSAGWSLTMADLESVL